MGSKTKHKTGHKSDIYSPLPEGASCTVQHPTGRGRGRSGGLKGQCDRTEGLQGGAHSRNHGGQGARAGQETREAMADQESREAMADQETREAMADQETQEAMADQPQRLLPQPQSSLQCRLQPQSSLQ